MQVSKLLTLTRLKLKFSVISVFLSLAMFSQDTIFTNVPDSILFQNDSLPETGLISDTIKAGKLSGGETRSNAVKSKVDYIAIDSIRFDINTQKVFMFKESDITYEDINLKAAYVEIDFDSSMAFARGLPDTSGKISGDPVFTENGQTYKSETMKYNFDTKKGIIKRVFTEDGDGYLHGARVKKMMDGTINIQSGKYTTCNHEFHPHYEFRYDKSKVIPGKKIITGPAYLVIEDVPTPLFIPFGLFPNQKGQRSGIIIPTYGESSNRGFYFYNGGYYWAINDYMDLKLVGDIYTRGSWAVKPSYGYSKRYKFRGSLNLTYAINKSGEKGSSDYQEKKDFAIRWNHSQDPKARPNSKFSANVNVVSSQFNIYNPSTTEDYLSNTFQSSIAYQTNFNQKYFLTVNASHSQNTQTKIVNLTLPEISFSVNNFYPLERKNRIGKSRWYEEIRMGYSMSAKNTTSTPDSLLFKPNFLKEFRNGIKHSVPISNSFKLFKHLNLTNTINITDRMYFESYRKYWSNDTLFDGNDTIIGFVATDTVNKFNNLVDFSFSASLSTKIYGMVNMKKGPVRAIRHVLTPSVTFSYTPDFGTGNWGYYDYYYDENLDAEIQYSLYENAIFGTPPGSKSGRLNFSLGNNLEIKVRNKNDTVTGTKKIALIDNFSVSVNYDLAKDSLRWSKVSMSGRTRLINGMDLTYSSTWDPYVLDSTGNKNLNRFEWDVNRRLLRHDNTTWNVGLRLVLNSDKFKKKKETESSTTVNQDEFPDETENFTEQEIADVRENRDDYVDWDVPWSLNINYNLRYTNSHIYENYRKSIEEKLVQTLNFNGEVSITKKWKVGFRSGYDFEQNKLTYTSLNIYRDLHCWEMRFSWIPMGARKSWNFTLSVKSRLLQDLKLTKKKDFRDL